MHNQTESSVSLPKVEFIFFIVSCLLAVAGCSSGKPNGVTPNGVEPKPRFNGHPVSAFDGAMSHEAFEKLNAAIGARTLPLRTQVFSLKEVAEAHHRIEEGHVVGKIVLHVDL